MFVNTNKFEQNNLIELSNFLGSLMKNFAKHNVIQLTDHTPYSWNIMCYKSEGNCGLWVLNEITLKKYAESLKKIVGAVWELPAK